MKRIETPDGRFAAGDPITRKPGTIVTSTWMNALQDEICHVIEQAGLTLDGNDQTQLRAAIANMINGAIATHKHVIADVTGLQAALNGKLNNTGGTLTGNLTVNGFFIVKATDSKNAVLFLRDSAGNNRGNVFWDRNNDRVSLSRYDPETGMTAGWLRINTNNTVQTSHAITAPGFNGKATSADKLHTSPTINGVSFNGTSNIITSRWGAERTLKIGNKSRTVNGSANVTWTLAEIGAASDSHNHTAEEISDASAVGRDVLKAADKAAARIAIGAGTSSLKLGTTSTTAKAGNWKPDIDADTEGQLPYSRLTGVPDAGGVSYVAGDTYLVSQVLGLAMSSLPGGGGGDNQAFHLIGNLIATSDGTVRFRATQRGGLRVRLDGTQVAYWSTQHSDADRTLNLEVARGQMISVDMRRVWTNTAAHVTNARFLSATPAPFLIPAVYFYIPPPPPPPPDYGDGPD